MGKYYFHDRPCEHGHRNVKDYKMLRVEPIKSQIIFDELRKEKAKKCQLIIDQIEEGKNPVRVLQESLGF
jgi:hypothetical protein